MTSTVILGAGIIGLSSAYYLSKRQPGSTIHLVDSSPTLFSSASGFAGGFLAKDWFPHETASLGELSFEEHRKLAEKHNGAEKWGYAKCVTLTGGAQRRSASVVGEQSVESHNNLPKWLNVQDGQSFNTEDEGDGTAIV